MLVTNFNKSQLPLYRAVIEKYKGHGLSISSIAKNVFEEIIEADCSLNTREPGDLSGFWRIFREVEFSRKTALKAGDNKHNLRVLEYLKSLGGVNSDGLHGNASEGCYYYIDGFNVIECSINPPSDLKRGELSQIKVKSYKCISSEYLHFKKGRVYLETDSIDSSPTVKKLRKIAPGRWELVQDGETKKEFPRKMLVWDGQSNAPKDKVIIHAYIKGISRPWISDDDSYQYAEEVPEYKLPKINSYEGVLREAGNSIVYGCARFSIKVLRQILKNQTLGSRNIKAVVLDSNVTITILEINQILEYVDNQ